MTHASDNNALEQSARPLRRWRFSLATLLLAIALGLAILANVMQHMIAREREVEVSQIVGHWHRAYGNHYYDIAGVKGEDPKKIHVSLLPTGRDDEWIWQISLAERREFRICYTTEGITEQGFPRFQAATAPLAGNVWIKFSWRHPPEGADYDGLIAWFSPQSKHGSSAHGWSCIPPKNLSLLAVAGDHQRAAFNPGSPVELLRMRARSAAEQEVPDPINVDAPRAGILIWIEPVK